MGDFDFTDIHMVSKWQLYEDERVIVLSELDANKVFSLIKNPPALVQG
jgi:hypothetical protein